MKPSIVIGARTYVPQEYLKNPTLSVWELTLENGSWSRGGTGPQFFAEAEAVIDLATGATVGVYFPRALDLTGHLKPGLRDVPIEAEILCESMWPQVWLGDIDPVLGPNEFIAYDQAPAWEALMGNPHTWPFGRQLVLACGRGKTALSLKFAQQRARRTLVVCHTLNMATQWSEEASNLLGYPRELHGFIGDGNVDWKTRDLVFSSMPGLTCREYPEEFWYHFGTVIFDEGDMFGSAVNRQTLSRFVAERLFVTATPERPDGNDMLFPLHVGPECFRDISEDIIPEVWGVTTPVVAKLPFVTKTRRGKENINYKDANQMIRNRRFKRPVANIPKTVSVLSEWIDRKEWCLGLVLEQLQEGRKILFVGERVDELQWFDREFRHSVHGMTYTSGLVLGKTHTGAEETKSALKCDVIWAIQQLGKRGLNQREIDTVVLQYVTFNDPGKLRQLVGRCTRYHPDKKHPRVIVLLDKPSFCLFDNAINIVQQLMAQGCQVTWFDYE